MTACGCVSWRTPRSVCVLSARCPCCLCVQFLRPGRCTRSHRTGLCQHAFPKGETSVHCTPDVQDTHSPNSYVRSTRIPSHLLSPGLQGTEAASARCVHPCLANLLGMAWKRCCAISANARSGGGPHHPRGLYSNSPGGPHHPCGLYSTEARDSETHPRRHGSPVQMSPRLKTPVSPSSNPVDGKECVSSAHVRDRG